MRGTSLKLVVASLLVVFSACSSDPVVEDVSAAPDELALAAEAEPVLQVEPITEADIPDGVDSGPTDEELAAEAADERPDVAPGVLAMENADRSFEARLLDDALSGDSGPIEVELGSMVAFSLITNVTDSLVIDDLDLSAATNGDVAQLVFVADLPGTFEVRLRSTGRLIAELIVS